jgi:hypothetical protein
MCAITVVATLVMAITVAGITVVGIMVVATTTPVQRRPQGSRSAFLGPRQGQRRRRHTITGGPAITAARLLWVLPLLGPELGLGLLIILTSRAVFQCRGASSPGGCATSFSARSTPIPSPLGVISVVRPNPANSA